MPSVLMKKRASSSGFRTDGKLFNRQRLQAKTKVQKDYVPAKTLVSPSVPRRQRSYTNPTRRIRTSYQSSPSMENRWNPLTNSPTSAARSPDPWTSTMRWKHGSLRKLSVWSVTKLSVGEERKQAGHQAESVSSRRTANLTVRMWDMDGLRTPRKDSIPLPNELQEKAAENQKFPTQGRSPCSDAKHSPS